MENNQSSMLRHVLWAVVLAILCTLGASRASADTLTFVGTTGAAAGGVAIYPYIGSLNGGPDFDMMCLNYNITSHPGSWAVTVTNIGSLPLSSPDVAAALIMYDINTGVDTNVGEAQFAVWYLLDPSLSNSYFTANMSAIEGIASSALTAVAGEPAGFFNQFSLYTPTPDATSNQSFIGMTSVPEPATLALLGTGLVGLGGLLRRKLFS